MVVTTIYLVNRVIPSFASSPRGIQAAVLASQGRFVWILPSMVVIVRLAILARFFERVGTVHECRDLVIFVRPGSFFPLRKGRNRPCVGIKFQRPIELQIKGIGPSKL